MGNSIHYRGFNDDTLYVAYNTRSKVTPTKVSISACWVYEPLLIAPVAIPYCIILSITNMSSRLL